MYKRKFKSILAKIILVSTAFQSAMGAEVVIKCTGTSNMTIYNPHGEGGSIGGPSDKTWTIKVNNANSVFFSNENEENHEFVEASNVYMGVDGLSFCTASREYQCDIPIYKRHSGDYVGETLVSPTTISPRGEIYDRVSIMNTAAAIRTGVEIVGSGQCDGSSVEALMRMANSKDTAEDTADQNTK